jgi:hypothetical protein
LGWKKNSRDSEVKLTGNDDREAMGCRDREKWKMTLKRLI